MAAAASVQPASPARRIIACLDVRANDTGDLVVTKGDQYDVREKGDGGVRNHGKPVALAERYYQDGADEVSFLNITAFRDMVLADQPMLEVLRSSAQRVFVPLTVGGGIRSYVDGNGQSYSALDVADAYFRAGADKISIGSDAVDATRAFYASGRKGDGTSSIELISTKYGRQAVVVSLDPRRVYVADRGSTEHHCVGPLGSEKGTPKGPNGEAFAWYCCTVKGGREDSEFDVVQLAQAVEALGAGELLLNCINRDGQGNGYELELIQQVKSACTLPVIASSGAGCPEHFEDALAVGEADAALAAGIFHREEARVLTKSDVRKFNNSRGEGQLFKVDLKDQSGEMSATFFGRAVDKYYNMLKCGQVYTFQKGQVKAANKRYDSGDFVLSFEEHADIKAVEEDTNIPRISYDFKPLCDVANMPPETSVDVKAVVYSVQAPFTFVAKTSNKEMTKREIGLWDPSGSSGHSTMELVLWNERAVGTDFEIGAVVFLKKARISEFNQMKSLGSPAQLELHSDHEDSFLLMRKFKDFQDSGQQLASPSKFSNSSGQRKTIEECKQEDLKLASPGAMMGGGEKGVHKHTVVATLTSMPTDRAPYYSSCPQQVESNAPASRHATMRICNKKVSQRENGEWTCMGGHVSSYPEFRYLCRLNVLDHTDQMEVNLYDDVVKNLLGREARDYMAIFEAAHNGGEGAQPLKEVNQKMEWKKCSLVLRSSKEIWQENERVRYSVDSAQPIPLEQDARQMLGDIMASLEA
ncbi:unnamed protein product [Cladocopium goreaui]|uniref:imidazole glycerol-phosphate synthase n=1 Tax=Cladocopium goreaui TaxID=2562237 RepID=A0A9P1CW50_9DINO|nr:unnamed protein product [Cladocopium goreaui]